METVHTYTAYSERLERAVRKAAHLHRNQVRLAEDGLPYASHLFSVFVLLLSYTRDEDVLIAGLLHDSVEDTNYTFEELERDFGGRVLEMVRGVTEVKERDGKKLPWKERKLGILRGLEGSSEESMLVCAADKIHNLTSLVLDYETHGEKLWQVILEPGAHEKLWYHREVIAILERRMKNRRALADLKQTYDKAQRTLLEKSAPLGAQSIVGAPLGRLTVTTRRMWSRGIYALKTLLSKALSVRIFGYGSRNTG